MGILSLQMKTMRLREVKWLSCCPTQPVSNGVRIEPGLPSPRAQALPAACLCCLPPPWSLCWRPSQRHRSCRQLDYVNYSIPSNNYSWLFEDSHLQIYLRTTIYTPKSILQTIPRSLLDTCIELLEVHALSWPGTRRRSAPSFQLSYCNQVSFSHLVPCFHISVK